MPVQFSCTPTASLTHTQRRKPILAQQHHTQHCKTLMAQHLSPEKMIPQQGLLMCEGRKVEGERESESALHKERKKGPRRTGRRHEGRQQVALWYLLGLGLVLEEHLEEGSRERRVGQQGEGGGCSQEACHHSKVTLDRKSYTLSQ